MGGAVSQTPGEVRSQYVHFRWWRWCKLCLNLDTSSALIRAGV